MSKARQELPTKIEDDGVCLLDFIDQAEEAFEKMKKSHPSITSFTMTPVKMEVTKLSFVNGALSETKGIIVQGIREDGTESPRAVCRLFVKQAVPCTVKTIDDPAGNQVITQIRFGKK